MTSLSSGDFVTMGEERIHKTFNRNDRECDSNDSFRLAYVFSNGALLRSPELKWRQPWNQKGDMDQTNLDVANDAKASTAHSDQPHR